MSSVFDPETFMSEETTEAGSTAIAPIPVGEYTAIISDVKPRVVTTKRGEAPLVDLIYDIQDAALQEQLGRDKITVRQSIWLDTKDGKLDMGEGKNVNLNRVREALHQNVPGQAWSLSHLRGAGPVKIYVKQRPGDGDVIYNEVGSVGRLE